MMYTDYAGADVPGCAQGWEAGAEVELRRIAREIRAERDLLRQENLRLAEEVRRLTERRDDDRGRPQLLADARSGAASAVRTLRRRRSENRRRRPQR